MVKQQRKIVTFIALIVILTISIQTYWNYVQYDNNRIQIIVELQNILDKVSTDYTKNNTKKSLLKAGATTSEIETIKLDSIQKIAKRILKESRSTIQLNQKKNWGIINILQNNLRFCKS
jgi:two-component system phosphate regulon sensor histidine kinase PhoR